MRKRRERGSVDIPFCLVFLELSFFAWLSVVLVTHHASTSQIFPDGLKWIFLADWTQEPKARSRFGRKDVPCQHKLEMIIQEWLPMQLFLSTVMEQTGNRAKNGLWKVWKYVTIGFQPSQSPLLDFLISIVLWGNKNDQKQWNKS